MCNAIVIITHVLATFKVAKSSTAKLLVFSLRKKTERSAAWINRLTFASLERARVENVNQRMDSLNVEAQPRQTLDPQQQTVTYVKFRMDQQLFRLLNCCWSC